MSQANPTSRARLTPKQKLFISAYCSNGFNGTQAAIEAEYSKNSAAEIANENLRKPHIVAAIDEYKEAIANKHEVTVNTLITELEVARQKALDAETPQVSAAVSATLGKAKLCGLDKQIIDHRSSDGSMTPGNFNDFYSEPQPES